MNEKTGVIPPGVGRWQTFSVTTTGGAGSFSFKPAVTGKVYHRQVTPPPGVTSYNFYVQNSAGILHDVHSATGTIDVDDLALWADEVLFVITGGTGGDGTYAVTIWVGE